MDGGQTSDRKALLVGLLHPSAPLSVRLQRSALADAGCEMAFEITSGVEGSRRVNDLLQRLGPGSRLFVTGMEAFNRPLPETLRIAAGLLDAGVEICVVDRIGGHSLTPGPATAQALRAVAAFAAGEKSRATSAGGRPAKGESLSKVQAQFARKLYEAGESPRTIGLICRVSPDAVMEAVGSLATRTRS